MFFVQPIFCPYGTRQNVGGIFISTNMMPLTGHIRALFKTNRKLATKKSLIVLEIKNDLTRLFADLVEKNKIAYFVEHSHFGAIGRHSGADHFFSPAQYFTFLQ
jgi:hypothetical protein